jgi:hypothetical protein
VRLTPALGKPAGPKLRIRGITDRGADQLLGRRVAASPVRSENQEPRFATFSLSLLTIAVRTRTLWPRFALITVLFNSQCPSLGRPFYLATSARVAPSVRRSMTSVRINRHNGGVLDTEGKAP